MFKSSLKNTSIGFILIFYCFQVIAAPKQEKQLPCHSNKAKLDDEVKKALVINKVAPKYPRNAARKKQEGWVRLSFVVREDGSVDLPIVEDSSGIKSFEKAAKQAVKSWVFDPATRGGKTIEQCQNSVQLDFVMNKPVKGASRKFVKEYRKLMQLIEEKKLTEAKLALSTLEKKPRQNFYEDRFFFNVKATYFNMLGNKRLELANLKKLIPSGKNYLPKDTYEYSISRAFQLSLINNELSSSLYFYNKLKESDATHEHLNTLKPYVDKVKALIASPKHIFVAAQINERENWHHYLARNSFTFTNIEGELSTIDIRCDNHFSTYSIESEKQWSIPESWGQCKLFVHGDQGATFDLVELAT